MGGGGSDIVRDLFQVQLETVLQCSESEEQVSETTQVRRHHAIGVLSQKQVTGRHHAIVACRA